MKKSRADDKEDARKKSIIIMCGLSGSGKSFNSAHLSKKLDKYVHLNAEETKQEFGIFEYSRKDTSRVLARIVEKMQELSSQDKCIIVDANKDIT